MLRLPTLLRLHRRSAVLQLILLIVFPVLGQAAQTPFFRGADGKQVDSLPLEFSEARVDISHAIASVTLTQRFGNRGEKPIEAVYVFPGASSAAVRGLSLSIGERRIEAQIREKSQAKHTYDTAKDAGQTASLLKQTAAGTYEINVANILPGDAIEVQLRYVELLTPSKGRYRFLLPNTFGQARYKDDTRGHSRLRSDSDQVVQDAWFVSARVQSSVPIATLESPSHEVQLNRSGATDVQVLLDPQERRAATKDFVLEYTLSGGEVQTGLMLYERDGQGWYLWTMEPPLEVLPEQIPSREFIFVLDVSGSMEGPPLDIAKRLMRSLAQVLRPSDYLNAIAFAGASDVLSESSLPATQDTVERLLEFVDSRESSGGTELLPAIERAYGLPHKGAMRSIVIVTDGGIGMAHAAAGRIGAELARTGTFVFGVGDYLEPQTLNLLANAAQTRLLSVQNNTLDEAALNEFRAYVDRPLLRDVRLQFDTMTVEDQLPANVPILYAARPLTVLGRYQPPARGMLSVSAHSAQGRFERSVNVDAFRPNPAAEAIRHLWAQRQVETLLARDERDSQREAVTKLGLDYGMMTPWTSFVAVDREVRNPEGDSSTVQQPSAQRATVDYASGDQTAQPGANPFASRRHRGTRSLMEGQCQLLAGMAFRRQGSAWSSSLQPSTATTSAITEIRLRRGGAAWRQLLALAPQLQALTNSSDSFDLRFGSWRLLISSDGFDHYPAATLAQLAAALAQAQQRQLLPRACADGGR